MAGVVQVLELGGELRRRSSFGDHHGLSRTVDAGVRIAAEVIRACNAFEFGAVHRSDRFDTDH